MFKYPKYVSTIILVSGCILIQTSGADFSKYVHVNQFSSTNYPYTSCVAACAKIVCNILCRDTISEYCSYTVSDISLEIDTNSEGAYMSKMDDFLTSKEHILSQYVTRDNDTVKNIISNIEQGFVGVVLVNMSRTSDSSGYRIGLSEYYNHALVIYDYEYVDNDVRFKVADPFKDYSSEYYIDATALESVLIDDVYMYASKDEMFNRALYMLKEFK